MTARDDSAMAELLRQSRCAWVIAKKNARVYYLKGPVITFGIVSPCSSTSRSRPGTTRRWR